MGAMHDTDTVAAALGGGNSGGVQWRFQASGSGYAKLRRMRSGEGGVSWGEQLGDSDWQTAMKLAQVALVTIAPGAERVVMPSKTYSALVAGQAILAVCRRESDLADLVLRHDCGWVIEPGDAAALRSTVAAIAGRPDELLTKRRNAFAAGQRHYDMASIAADWLALFRELSAGCAGDARSR
jgi:hypothetical protein